MSEPVKHTCIGSVYPHPKCQACVLDAQRQCGYWISTTTERCGQCERCKREPQPYAALLQQPSADTIASVRALYRDDLAAMADSLLRLRADLAEARRTKTEDR